MILVKIFKNGKEIDKGIFTGGCKADKSNERMVAIVSDTNIYNDERIYYHTGEIYFQEFQDNGKGFELVYDSREGIDRTVEYPLPSWLFSNSPIPNITHKINENGDVTEEFHGYYM